MPAHQSACRLFYFCGATTQCGIDDGWRDQVGRDAQEIYRGERAPTDRRHVRERVRSGNLAVRKWVVDDRRKKVDRLHECAGAVNAIDPRVVRSGCTDQQIRIVKGWESAQNLRESLLAQFRR